MINKMSYFILGQYECNKMIDDGEFDRKKDIN